MPVHRPWVFGQPRPDLVEVIGVDQVCGVVPATDWAADNDDTVHKGVHARGMFHPAVLLPDLTGVVPRRPMYQRARKCRMVAG